MKRWWKVLREDQKILVVGISYTAAVLILLIVAGLVLR
jgi:hypothetical protein